MREMRERAGEREMERWRDGEIETEIVVSVKWRGKEGGES